MIKQKIILLFFGLFFLYSMQSLAIETGEIQGKVHDEKGIGLPGVEITAVSSSLQGVRTAISSKTGEFHFPLLPVGNYNLVFKLEGFNPLVQKNVIVRLGMATSLKVKMEISEIQEEIVVTAERPLIDKTSIDTSYRLSSEDLEKIPAQNRTVVDVVKFTPGVSGVRANTRRGQAIEGQPSFRGEGEEGNNWIVDGLSISGVRLKNSGMKLNLDSIEEIQIISDPFSPEFGSAYGGIINMVTKSGSNDFQGELSLVFMNKHLQSARQEQLSIVTEPEYFSNYNWYFNLGGPLIKDKLWFFISNNLYWDTEETRDSSLDYFFIEGGKKTIRNNNLFAKLSYSLNSNHNLSLTGVLHKSLRQKGGTGIPDVYEEKHFTDTILRVNYKGILNASTFIEAGLGQAKRDSLIEPTDGDLGPAMYFIEDIAQNIHNSYGNITDNHKRFDFSFKLTKHLETDTFGNHELSFGFEYYNFSSEFWVDFTGKEEDPFPQNGFDSGTKYSFETWKGGRGTPTFLYEYGEFSFLNSALGIGLFFKDKVSWNRFTLMAGFRTQTQLCRDEQGNKLWSWNLQDFLSPRFSLAVDLTGDGSNVIKLGWGRFSDVITTMPLGLFSSGAGLTFSRYKWNSHQNPSPIELHQGSNWEFIDEQKSQSFEISPGMTPNFATRYLIEYDRKLGANWALKTRYVRLKAEYLLEVLAVLDLETENNYKFLYDNFEHKRRNYSGVEVELNGRIGQNFFLNSSYSYSSSKGTNPGQSESGSWSQEEGSTTYIGLFGNHLYVPDIPELKKMKEFIDWALGGLGGRGIGDEGWYGKLPYALDHNIKINLVYLFPFGVSLSTSFEWLSGYYWEKLGLVPLFGYYALPEGRGTRKTPAHAYLDVGLEKEFQLKNSGKGFPHGLKLALRLDMFNLLNSQEPISYVKEDTAIFGAVWGRQQPRQARMMIKLKW
ncbi:MAG: carboxypeptidase regulatory-like domain-containing protein [Candidatus Aminicenantaceae bacterium]